jgi:UDP-N-acetylmuramoyl-L-alanyl-D-glutamate--2,6-diaminopimelate ligase
MGETAELNADKVILTADNPRSENNEAIVTDILKGLKKPEHIYIEHDRRLAINYASSHASSRDIVLVAGKGHELYQEVAGVKMPFSDKQVVIQALQAANDEHTIQTGVEQ